MTTWTSKNKNVTLYHADCREVELSGVTAVVTDPPYGIKFMSKGWDHGVPGQLFWKLIATACLPGAPLLAFGGDRTHHRLMVAIEDAGWELRTCLYWLFGSGFPKSLSVSKAIDKAAGMEREVVGPDPFASNHPNPRGAAVGQNYGTDLNPARPITAPATPAAKLWHGYGTALKPAAEIITLAMKPMGQSYAANAIEHGVAGLNIDGGRVGTENTLVNRRNPSAELGYHGQGSRSCVTGSCAGRWPANVIHNGSPEVLAGMPESNRAGGVREIHSQGRPASRCKGAEKAAITIDHGDSGSAARFFYCAKASKAERSANWKVYNTHATVKPLALMRYLLTLVTMPERNLILDPFMGSGSTGVAAVKLGLPFIGIEKDKESFEIARDRIKHTRVK